MVNFGSLPAGPVPIPRTNRLSDSCWRVSKRLARRLGSCSRIRITPLPVRSLFETARHAEQMSSDVKPPPALRDENMRQGTNIVQPLHEFDDGSGSDSGRPERNSQVLILMQERPLLELLFLVFHHESQSLQV